MYDVAHHPRRRLGLTRVLACCVLVSFALSALSIAYAAGRQQAFSAPPPPSSTAPR